MEKLFLLSLLAIVLVLGGCNTKATSVETNPGENKTLVSENEILVKMPDGKEEIFETNTQSTDFGVTVPVIEGLEFKQFDEISARINPDYQNYRKGLKSIPIGINFQNEELESFKSSVKHAQQYIGENAEVIEVKKGDIENLNFDAYIIGKSNGEERHFIMFSQKEGLVLIGFVIPDTETDETILPKIYGMFSKAKFS